LKTKSTGIFGPEKDEIYEKCTIQYEKIPHLYKYYSTVRIVRYRSLQWTCSLASIRKRGNACFDGTISLGGTR
jgi:hypothetical protein